MLILAGLGQGLFLGESTEVVDVEIPGYIELEGDTVDWRIGPRGDKIYIDKTLTPNGFTGTEGVDWVNVEIRQGP